VIKNHLPLLPPQSVMHLRAFNLTHWSNSKGFTLLEIIVAVAIFGVISSIIFPALLQFLDMRERVVENNKQVAGLQKTFLFLANDLRYAANRLGKDEYGQVGKSTLIIGDDSLIDLTALYPDLNINGLNVPRRVRWIVEDGVLNRIQSPVMDPSADTRTIKQSLIEDVEDVDIIVYHIEDGRNNEDDKWDEKQKLPDMIELEITLTSGTQYRRLFTMLGGDPAEVIESFNQPANQSTGSGNTNTPVGTRPTQTPGFGDS